MLKIIECPRDAMQGIKHFIPTETKVKYIQQLLKVGFDTIDVGSFVSPKMIPQMQDTPDVLRQLDMSKTKSKLLTIVANLRGAQEAVGYEQVTYLGFPFSVSPTFQMRNTNATMEEALQRVEEIFKLCEVKGKTLVVYLSMGFGNPYGDEWNVATVQKWVDILADMGVRVLSLSDTIGCSTPENIEYLFGNLIPPYPDVEFGAHLHTERHNWREKINAAYKNGCLRFDTAIKGFGGCPMAKDDLTGNMPTENLIDFLKEHKQKTYLNYAALRKAEKIAIGEIFL
jgi:hydroxymethylglutaryl-CoA lyase